MTLQEILKDKKQAIAMKKAAIKHADSSLAMKAGVKSAEANKEFEQTQEDQSDVINRSFVANTYYWMDSHRDVHVKGCFKKSIDENGQRVFHLADHEFKTNAKIGEPASLSEVDIPWSSFGVDMSGNTTAVVMSSNIYQKYNENLFTQYLNNKIDRHSVGMYYVKLDLAINDPEEKEEFKNWSEIFPLIGNKEEAEKVGYFWIVREAKLVEVSAVLEGSNELTDMIDIKNTENIQPPSGTEKTEPPKSTQKTITYFY